MDLNDEFGVIETVFEKLDDPGGIKDGYIKI